MGLEFIELFDEWADTYDQTVLGDDKEYRAVFKNYDRILQAVADRVQGKIIEFGVGTGNLTEKLLNSNNKVIGFEPSLAMREKALEKLTNVNILNGDFLSYNIHEPIDAIVSTYAFHHLTDDEKASAFSLYQSVLATGGKIVFADTVFISDAHKQTAIHEANLKGYLNLARDLATEYYSTIPSLEAMLKANHFSVEFTQLNSFVWLMDATKL
ncbi:class I SAM-dependent DNA methyltransferase [Bacillus marasmi]|uniref:class I SAM-dependent DNA methyltransferase n=1 Tax=Bacillus marasmi TaxID=1926279 RepID=UPI0011C724B9|nr:class I SAM-dependent methyltransferase [Bacillus marasmi]